MDAGGRAWANFSVTSEGADIIDGTEGVILVGMYAGALLGSTVLLLVLGFILFQGRKGLKFNTSLIAALVAGLFVWVGAAHGLVGAGEVPQPPHGRAGPIRRGRAGGARQQADPQRR